MQNNVNDVVVLYCNMFEMTIFLIVLIWWLFGLWNENKLKWINKSASLLCMLILLQIAISQGDKSDGLDVQMTQLNTLASLSLLLAELVMSVEVGGQKSVLKMNHKTL